MSMYAPSAAYMNTAKIHDIKFGIALETIEETNKSMLLTPCHYEHKTPIALGHSKHRLVESILKKHTDLGPWNLHALLLRPILLCRTATGR